MYKSVINYKNTAIILLFYTDVCQSLCPEGCYCRKNKAFCVNKNMTFIPKFPPTINSVNFTGNFLPIISQQTFYNVSFLHIYQLCLANCAIEHIENESFSMLKHLQRLDLSGNKLSHYGLQKGLASLKKTNISILLLRRLKLRHAKSLFFSLFNSSLTVLDLGQNNIKFLNGSEFNGLQSLQILNVFKNDLDSLDFNGLHHIKTLNISFNKFRKVSDFCHGNERSKLNELDISNNHINNFSPEKFRGKCFPELTSLFIGTNAAEYLPDNLVSNLPSLKTFNVEWMTRTQLTFSSFTFNSSTLQELFISNHMEDFFNRNDYINIFRLCPNIKLLRMTALKFDISAKEGTKLQKMLSPLSKIEILIMRSCRIQILPTDLIKNMINLRHIDVSNNQISSWDADFFQGLIKLKVIKMALNQIFLINKTSVPNSILNNLRALDLKNNPLTCNCDALWFRNFVKTHNTSFLKDFPALYICSSPLEWKDVRFLDFNPSLLQCIGPLGLTTIVVVSVLISLFIIFTVLYRFRWHLKHYIYLIRSKKEYEKIPGESQSYVYDAFVAYDEGDKIWVISELISNLEKQKGLKLFLHDRDFVIGKLIVDNVCEENRKSRKTIMVLSNNFAKSYWCQFQMTLAHARHLSESQNHLIVILLEQIDSKYLNSALNVLLSSTTYIEWDQAERKNQLFWERLLVALKE